MPQDILAALRAVHVVTASFWLGAMLMNAGFVLPAVRAAGPAGGAVMGQLVGVRRLPQYINLAVWLTLLSGGALMWAVSAGFSRAWFTTSLGTAFTAGGLLALSAAALGQFVNAPTAARLGRLAAQAGDGPPSAEVAAERQRLQGRLFRATQAAALLLVLSAACMGAARYL